MPGNKLAGKYYLLIASALFFVPVLIIAFISEWQYDEAWTYMGIMHSSSKDIVEYTTFKLANNHVINSLYFRWLQSLGAKAEIIYRLLSLLSYGIYCLFIYKLLRQAEYTQGKLSYIVLFLLPYMGFFSLGRGYAPALACFTAALYFYKSFERTKATTDLLGLVLAGGIAAVSLFSFTFPFIALLVVLTVNNFGRLLKPVNILVLLPVVPVVLYVFMMGRVVNKYDLYIVGGHSLFNNGALSSIISYLSLSDSVPFKVFLWFKILLCASLLPAVAVLVRRKVLYVEHVIMLVTVLLMVLGHLLLGAKYPMFRGLMYMLLLIYLPFVYSSSKSHYLITTHLLVLGTIGACNTGLLLDKASRHKSYDALAYMAKLHKPLFIDNVNPNLDLYDHLYFNDSIKLLHYEMEEPEVEKSFYKALDTAEYVVCTQLELGKKKVSGLFTEKYRFPEDDLFTRKQGR